MATQTIGTAGAAGPMTLNSWKIELKELWSGEWAAEPGMELVSVALHAGSARASTATVTRRYGTVKYPGASSPALGLQAPLDITDWWIRITLGTGEAAEVIFQGLIQGQAREITGSPAVVAGVQTWEAADGLKLLQKQVISQSVFLSDVTNGTSMIDWIPAMNIRDKNGLLVGNSTPWDDDHSYYGGVTLWTHKQYLDYLIFNFIQQTGGPTWTMTGQTDILDSMTTSIEFPQALSAAAMIKLLVPVKYGLDFQIVPTDAGFAIDVFSLLREDQTFGDTTMPANANTVDVVRGDGDINLFSCKIAESAEQTVATIQVIGQRIVVCGTLTGANAHFDCKSTDATLVPKWSSALEADYIAPGGGSDDALNDTLRKREKYNNVYQLYGAPHDWDMTAGLTTNGFAVQSSGNGNGTVYAGYLAGTSGDLPITYQTWIRNTLTRIPLKEGYDYSSWPPVANTVAAESESGNQSDWKAPLTWVWAKDNSAGGDGGSGGEEDGMKNILVHLLGIGQHSPTNEWGVYLNATPNHKLGAPTFTGGTDYSGTPLDYTTLIATVAIEADHRLVLTWDTGDGDEGEGGSGTSPGDFSSTGSVMTIVDDSAACWVLLPHTALDTDSDGNIIDSGMQMRILRDDTPRLALAMAGAIARYGMDRGRAMLNFKGLLPVAGVRGWMMTHVTSGSGSGLDVEEVNAVVTTISWKNAKSPTTTISTGYA